MSQQQTGQDRWQSWYGRHRTALERYLPRAIRGVWHVEEREDRRQVYLLRVCQVLRRAEKTGEPDELGCRRIAWNAFCTVISRFRRRRPAGLVARGAGLGNRTPAASWPARSYCELEQLGAAPGIDPAKRAADREILSRLLNDHGVPVLTALSCWPVVRAASKRPGSRASRSNGCITCSAGCGLCEARLEGR